MNIVVVNDDGIKSEGLKELALVLKELGKVTVIAPSEQKSGAGHWFTCDKPIQFKKIEFEKDIDGYIINGTPRDCTDFAHYFVFRDQKIDLLVSGINYGCNVASDMVCSGTCGAGSTGIIYGTPCMATSLDFGASYDFKMAASYIIKIAKWYLKQDFKYQSCLNVNIPNMKKEDIKGIKVAEYGGNLNYHVDYEVENNAEGSIIKYNLTNVTTDGKQDLTSDLYALRQGYITLTPIDLNLVKYEYLEKVKDKISELEI